MEANNKPFVSESVKQSIIQKNEHNVFRKAHFKYLVMRVRAKISFMAFLRRMTIVELFAVTIKRCYLELINSGSIQ